MESTLARQNLHRLSQNAYPGRGIVLGLNASGTHFLQVYWVMGRSANSRNRVMAVRDGRVRLEPFDAKLVQDPSLIMYTAMDNVGAAHVVTNGDQTDTVTAHIKTGGSFASALLTRQHEPDGPHFTPRISGLIELGPDSPTITASKIVHDPSDAARSVHCFYSYAGFAPGTGVCWHTYAGDGNPLPSFAGDPYLVELPATGEETANQYWSLLNADNKVALAVKAVDMRRGSFTVTVRNRHGK